MRAGRTWPLAAAVFVVLALAAPAAAHENAARASSWLTEDHPGWYWPSTSSQTGELRDGRQRRADAGRLEHVPQLGPRVLGPAAPTPATTRASRSSTRGTRASRSSSSTSRARARSTTSRSGAACCSSRSRRRARARRATRRPSRPARPASRASASSTSRNPRSPVADRRRADRLRLAHPHAGPRPAPPAACCSTSPRTRPRELAPSTLRQRVQARSTRTASRCTTRSPSSRCRCATRPRRASSASRASRRRTYRDGLVRLPRHHGVHGARDGGRAPAWARARSGTSPTSSTRATVGPRVQPERRVLPLGDVLLRRPPRDLRRRGGRRHQAQRCTSADPATRGALWFYDVRSIRSLGEEVVTPRSSWKVPRIQEKLTPEQAQRPELHDAQLQHAADQHAATCWSPRPTRPGPRWSTSRTPRGRVRSVTSTRTGPTPGRRTGTTVTCSRTTAAAASTS